MVTKNNAEQTPTFEEFKNAVKEDFLRMDDSKVSRRYFETDEAQKTKLKEIMQLISRNTKPAKLPGMFL